MDIVNFGKRTVRAFGLERPARALIESYARKRPRQICKRGGITYDLNLLEVIDRALFMGAWEFETVRFLRKCVRPGDVVIEVGANVGAHTLTLANLVRANGVVYAFEPTSYAQGKLRANLALNPQFANRVIIRSELVTNHSGDAPNLKIRSSFPVDGSQPDEVVPSTAMSLDDLDLTQLDFIKIDVDGYDYKVLQGAVSLIKKFKPVILVELCEYALNAQGDSIRDIFHLLSEFGYAGARENGAPISAENALRLVGNSTSINSVFRV